jgi:plasmid stabilization system protein ParE
MHAVLRIEARRDLRLAADFYEDQHLGLGDRFLDYIAEMLEELETLPAVYSKLHGFHCKSLRRFPFAIYYLVKDETIDVVAVIDQRAHPLVIASRLRREGDSSSSGSD